MIPMKKIGVLALQGGVEEHIAALLSASEKLGVPVQIAEVRAPDDLEGVDGIILPGGESTTLSKLIERAELAGGISHMRKVMGTCAGAILLAKKIEDGIEGQKPLCLMDISAKRNAYGSQLASFEATLTTIFGTINGVFIRAPKISIEGRGVQPLAFYGEEVVGAYQKKGERHFLAFAFHPELTSTKFHEFFIRL
ncbi:MAG: pyridoxal 5'-phosphate synthase glutaminase subunit PdxT [Candidatus Micrarchaeota archaeon]|nr:pyridoxal 5'-phosphate synthase glutaminase subunit PdxT [Candidatus Micrarchaeota archaeon]